MFYAMATRFVRIHATDEHNLHKTRPGAHLARNAHTRIERVTRPALPVFSRQGQKTKTEAWLPPPLGLEQQIK
jgi:hypothetical protein